MPSTANASTYFAPYLFIPRGITDITFYEKAWGAVEHRRWCNEDGSIHVAELAIENWLFHLHEEKPEAGQYSPNYIHGTTAQVGLFVPDVDIAMERALAAGGIVTHPARSYDYGYRQGSIRDPFGHTWLLQSKI